MRRDNSKVGTTKTKKIMPVNENKQKYKKITFLTPVAQITAF